MSIKKFLALAITCLLAGVTIGWAVDNLLRIPTHGIITEYGLTATPSQIDWGNMLNGTSTNQSVTLTNTGSADFISLTAYYGNETTGLIDYTLSWDAEGLSLLVGDSLLANFTLTIYNATAGPFTFDIYIGDQG